MLSGAMEAVEVAVDLRATVSWTMRPDRRPEVDGYLSLELAGTLEGVAPAAPRVNKKYSEDREAFPLVCSAVGVAPSRASRQVHSLIEIRVRGREADRQSSTSPDSDVTKCKLVTRKTRIESSFRGSRRCP